jgi:ATP-dependent DNA helicase RecG
MSGAFSFYVGDTIIWMASFGHGGLQFSRVNERFRSIFAQLCVHSAEVVENEQLEIKGWCKDEKELAHKIAEAAACLANAKGGDILVGIESKNEPRFSSCPFPNVNANWLVARIKDNTVPPVECEAHDLTSVLTDMRGAGPVTAFAITIPRSHHLCAHVTGKGISKIRVGKECRPYFTTADDDRTASIAPDVSVDDLSLTSLNWAIGQRNKVSNAGDSLSDPIELLVRSHLVIPYLVDGELSPRFKVTLAAVLLFGKEATLRKLVPFYETIVNANSHHRRILRNIVESVRELVLSENSISRFCPNLPSRTIKEILVNAYIHRCWRTAAPVVINISADIVEFENPGDLLPVHSSIPEFPA